MDVVPPRTELSMAIATTCALLPFSSSSSFAAPDGEILGPMFFKESIDNTFPPFLSSTGFGEEVKESVREKSESGSNNGIENESSNGRETGSGNDNVIGNGSREKGSRKGRRGKGRLPEREGRKKNEELNKLAEIKKKEIEQT